MCGSRTVHLDATSNGQSSSHCGNAPAGWWRLQGTAAAAGRGRLRRGSGSIRVWLERVRSTVAHLNSASLCVPAGGRGTEDSRSEVELVLQVGGIRRRRDGQGVFTRTRQVHQPCMAPHSGSAGRSGKNSSRDRCAGALDVDGSRRPARQSFRHRPVGLPAGPYREWSTDFAPRRDSGRLPYSRRGRCSPPLRAVEYPSHALASAIGRPTSDRTRAAS